MTWRNSKTKYGAASVGLHWLMLLLIAAVYACMEFRGIFPKGSALREEMKTWHYMLGLAVLGHHPQQGRRFRAGSLAQLLKVVSTPFKYLIGIETVG